MRLGSPVVRVSVGIAMLTVTLLLTADVIFGLSTEALRPHLAARKNLAETLAVQYSELASREDYPAMRSAMALLVQRNPEVLSTAVRRENGDVLAEAGDHRRHWRGAPPLESTETHARVPIFDGPKRWGTLEVRFTELVGTSFFSLLGSTWFKVLCFMALAGTAAYFVYMRRTLRHLDPSAVIPARVRAAFDVLAEGVVFVDTDERIVLANTTFARMAGSSPEGLMGDALSALRWSSKESDRAGRESLPWLACLTSGQVHTGHAMTLQSKAEGRRDLTVNAAPILDDAKKARGAIVTFDDVTEFEQKKNELEIVVNELRQSRDEIRRQNEKLEFIVTRDPMTHCLNRRAFMEVLPGEVGRARRDGTGLACIMLDIDHFKSVNDSFGHSVGDKAICFTSGVVSEVTRGFDLVCRYGGEEFCVLLPASDEKRAYELAERIRQTVQSTSAVSLPEIEGRQLTVSLGIAVLDHTIDDPIKLVDRADFALYESKRSGRNRTTLARDVPAAEPAVA